MLGTVSICVRGTEDRTGLLHHYPAPSPLRGPAEQPMQGALRVKFTPSPAPRSRLHSVEHSTKRWPNLHGATTLSSVWWGGPVGQVWEWAPCSAGSDFFSPGFRSVPNFNLWYLALEKQMINDDRRRGIDRASPQIRGPRS